MNLIEGLENVTPSFPKATVAIGTFDGVHIGHQAIMRTAVSDAQQHNRSALVFTFDRHPVEVLAPHRAPDYLTTSNQRNRWISDIGIDSLVVAKFDFALSQLSPDDFVQKILKEKLGAEAIVVGNNFSFGKGRAGDISYLQEAQNRFDFVLHALEPVLVDNIPASSTRVRECLREGKIAEAESILGHPYLLSGKIVQGQQLGRTLGFPTANLSLEISQVVPKDGIYAVQTFLDDGRKIGGACSIGNRPTVEGAGRCVETFLFDFDEDIYGHTMEIQFLQYLRPELKFDSLDALIQQMHKDVALAREVSREQ